MLPDEVRKAVEAIEFRLRGVWEPQADVHADFAAIKAHLLAREAEVERLQAIEKERWDVVATRNAAVMRAERAEAWLRKALGQVLSNIGFMAMHKVTDGSIESAKEVHDGITAHLSENSRG